jgi:hypothetical protein
VKAVDTSVKQASVFHHLYSRVEYLLDLELRTSWPGFADGLTRRRVTFKTCGGESLARKVIAALAGAAA